jgi:predicted nucleic acid-binding protein
MVVIDSFALIPLSRIGELLLVKDIFKEVISTQGVYKETVEGGKGRKGTSDLKEAFEKWIRIEEIDEKNALEFAEFEGLEKTDAEVILLVEKRRDILLANDRALIQAARVKGIDCYWVTTLILKAVKEGVVNKQNGRDLIYNLIEEGMNLENKVYAKILREIEEL